MSTTSSNLGLKLPEGTDTVTRLDYKGNLDILDAAIAGYDFDTLVTNKGVTLTTEFDTPTSGDITETLAATSGGATIATRVTVFDTPSAGQIQVTVTVTGKGSAVHVTTFDAPAAGDIQEVTT